MRPQRTLKGHNRIRPRGRCFLIVWLIAAFLWQGGTVAQAMPNDKFQEVTLQNGLHLFYRVMKGQPMVSLSAFVPIGMNYQNKRSIAHLLEHNIFRGSAASSFSDILEATSRQGGTFSGFTTFEATTFNYVTPRTGFEEAFRVFNDMIWNASLTEQNIALEQKIVVHEAEMNYPGRLAMYPVLHYLYPENNDTEATVHAISPGELKDFYRSYYQPANVTYVVAGDIDPKKVTATLETVRNIYGDSAKKIAYATIKGFALPRQDIVEQRNLNPYQYQVLLAYELNGLSPADRMILKILEYLYGETYRMDYQKNEYQDYYVATRSLGDKDYFGLYYLESNHPYDAAAFEKVKANLLSLARQFRKVDLTAERKVIVSRIELERAESDGSAAAAVDYEVQRLTNPDNLTVDSLAVLNRLTKKDLERVVARYLSQPPTTVVVVKNEPGGQAQ